MPRSTETATSQAVVRAAARPICGRGGGGRSRRDRGPPGTCSRGRGTSAGSTHRRRAALLSRLQRGANRGTDRRARRHREVATPLRGQDTAGRTRCSRPGRRRTAMNDERLDLELGELFHAAANVEIPDGLATRVAAIPARRPARRGLLGPLFGQGSEVNRPIGGGVRTRLSVLIGSLIVAALVVAGLIVVVPRVAPGVFAPISQCTLR